MDVRRRWFYNRRCSDLFYLADSLGGDCHWSVGASVISNLPLKPHWPLKAHMWLNAGRLDAIDQSELFFF